jgi:hypothetical protein
LISKDIVRNGDWYHSLYLAVHPSYYSAKSLPAELKVIAKDNAQQFLNQRHDWPLLQNLVGNAINFADESNTWADNKKTFFLHNNSIDRIRGEDFFKVFPELRKLETLME